jgi:hypothetical protein
LSCAICEERKEKRFCPAVHGRICPQCCGEQREVTLDCPSDCPYLLQAREHAAHEAQHQRTEKFTRDLPLPDVEVSEDFLYRHQELILGLSFALAKSARADRSLLDTDLIAALTSLAQSYQTLVNSHLIYEPPTANLSHQAIAREIETMVKEFREAEQRHLGQSRLRDSEILQALVFLVRLARARTSGRPKSRAFVDFLFSQFPEKQSSIATPAEASSRIVIP